MTKLSLAIKTDDVTRTTRDVDVDVDVDVDLHRQAFYFLVYRWLVVTSLMVPFLSLFLVGHQSTLYAVNASI